jgi:lipoprotein-releasing system permease protein
VYYISTLPVKMEALDVGMIALSAILISLVATLYPSRQAAKLDPAEALRYE